MASKHAARLGGDDYQHLYSWWLVLGLKLPDEHIQKVIVENREAGSVDDVTVHYEPNLKRADRFYQIKYHVDAAKTYSAKAFQAELLQKFWNTWHQLRQNNPDRMVELYLVSNWSWDRKEKPTIWINSATGHIDVHEFFSAFAEPVATIRQNWQEQLRASDEEFKAFIGCLYLRLQLSEPILKHELIVERMKRLKLKTDKGALSDAFDIVPQWIKDGKHEITLQRLEEALNRSNLYLPEEQERYISIYVETIARIQPERTPDYSFKWMNYFIDGDKAGEKGHQLKDPANWNKLLNELYKTRNAINQRSTCRLIRVSGKSRLCAWFAFGFTFSSVADYTLELDIPHQQWRTDAEASADFSLSIADGQDPLYGETIAGTGNTLAIGISAETKSDQDIRRYLEQQNEQVNALLLLQTNPGRLRDAGDAVALANSVKRYASAFVKQHAAQRLLLFYLGPTSGACFIGYRLNKVCPEIQIMEYQPGQGYAPSFRLTS